MPLSENLRERVRRLAPDPDRPPPGPTRPGFWRSPLRSTRLTAMLGLVLLFGLPVIAITGLLSNDAYQPGLGDNALGRDIHGPLDLYLFHWPSGFTWLYAVTQGAHVTIGLAMFPVVLVKLWSVIPKLFTWPPVRSLAHLLERISVALLVGSALFEFVTGILNIQYWYAFRFDFPQAHYYGGWMFIGALIAHICLKLTTMRRALSTRDALLRSTPAVPVAVPRLAVDTLVSPNPSRPTMSRRALLGAVGGASGILALQGIGQSIGGPLRRLTFLLPRGMTRPGPLGFPVNRAWAYTGLTRRAVGGGWRLTVVGPETVRLSRDELAAMAQRTHALPIACVEGWSTTQHWTGVPLADLARLVGADPGQVSATNVSLSAGTYGQATLGPEQVSNLRTLVALQVNGQDLPLDHGYPARVIGPAIPGVHCTKWLAEIHFQRTSA